MGEFGQDQPQPPEQPRSMRLPELIAHLRSGGGFPSEGFQMLSVDSTPPLGGELSLDPDGNPVYNFGHKFDPDFEGWEPGERVRSRFLVRKRPAKEGSPDQHDTVELLVSDSIVSGKMQHADTFVLEGLSPDELRTLETVGIAELDANVKVVSQIDERGPVSNMQHYKAKLDRINGIQAIYDGDPSKLERGPVLVEGRVEKYTVNMEYPYEGAKVTVRLENDKTADIELRRGFLDFEGGSLEIINPSSPLSGDTIQVQATYGKREGSDQDVLSAAFTRSTYLLQPSQERAEADKAQRRKVTQELDVLSHQEDPQVIRNSLSAMIRSKLYKKGSFDSVALTEEEKQRLRNIITAKFPDQRERPLDMLGNIDIDAGQEVQKVYGVDVYAMSNRQFFDFCMRVARGEEQPVTVGSIDAPYQVMMDHLPQEQQGEILQTAVNTLYSKVIGKRVISRKEILVDPQDLPDLQTREYPYRRGDKVVLRGDFDSAELADPDTVTRDDWFLFKQSLAYLSSIPTVHAADTYIALVRSMLEQDKFVKDRSEKGYEYFEREFLRSMQEHLLNNIQMNWEDMRVEGVEHADVVRGYLAQRPMLADLKRKLAAEWWTDTGAHDPRPVIDETIRILTLIEDQWK